MARLSVAARGLTRRSLLPPTPSRSSLQPGLVFRSSPVTLYPSSAVCSRSAKRFYNSWSSLETPRLSSSPFSTLKSSSPSPPTSTLTARRRINNKQSPSTIFRRHCSHRNMCMRGADIDHASNTAGREVLPSNVIPTNYDLTLEPNLSDFTFDGTVTISLKVVEDTSEVSVNVIEIDVHSAHISSSGISALKATETSYNNELQRVTFGFKETIPAGSEASLTIKFKGTLNDKMAGFYRSSYKAQDGSTQYLATSQMEPTDARRAFPCFDEPALKATFDVTLIADEKLTCLSNMDVKSERKLDGGKKSVSFNKSPPMSTYLLAFIVGDLRYIETDAFRLPVRVYATPGNEHHGKFSLELAAKTLKFYEETFDSPFPLPKMDMVAIPDFSAGAMENWGLITYRTVDLLFDETTSGASTKQRVAEVVQHELAHQWFGNLVTMDFWDGLWLNEGFATWMSWYSCNVFYPEWRVWDGYVTDNLQRALGLDSLRSSHPVEMPVKKASEINQIFDAISYSKGSCVLRMVSKWLGEDVFMKGIRQYLKKHAYQNTKTGDLWAALSAASGKDVEKVMDIWTKRVGFPVLSVTEDGNKIHIKQNRFLRTADVKPEEDEVLYPVFLGLREKSGIDKDVALYGRETTIEVQDPEFYKLNANHTGIYRTSYPPERLTKLGHAANIGLLSVEDRAGMVADAGALAQSGYQKTSGLLGLLSGFDKEEDFVVWDEISARLSTIRSAWLFEPENVKAGLKAFNRDLIAPIAHQVGWDIKPTDDHVLQQLKALAFGSAGLSGDEQVVKAASEMFEKFAKGDKKAINSNLRGSVYAIALANGGEREYDIILNEARTATNADERNTALRALGRSKDPKCIKRSLELALNGEVKEQDIYLPISALRTHAAGVEALWEWAKENWDTLVEKLPPGLSMLGSVVQIVTSGYCSEDKVEEIKKFFANKNCKGFEMGLAQALDSVNVKAGWIKRDKEDVEAWLKEHKYL